MDKIYLYKRIIIISSIFLLWAAILTLFVCDSLVKSLLFVIPAIIIFVFSSLLFSKAELVAKRKSNKVDETTSVETLKNAPIEKKSISLEKFIQTVPQSKALAVLGRYMLSVFSSELQLVIGAVFEKNKESNFEIVATYGFPDEYESVVFANDEGIVGQVAQNKQVMQVTDIPQDYPTVISGLGKSAPQAIVLFPIVYNNECEGVIELGFFTNIGQEQIDLMQHFIDIIIQKLHE